MSKELISIMAIINILFCSKLGKEELQQKRSGAPYDATVASCCSKNQRKNREEKNELRIS